MVELNRKRFLAAGAAVAGASFAGPRVRAQAADLKAVISSNLPITGVATRHGRTFACVARRGDQAGPQVVEIIDGRPRPYPDEAWNGWKQGDDPSKVF
ncbi:MAG: hypothetical protein JO111_10485, partial [Caulobacteraceae bacterium]|nr:hypothetical protein [Caulobacteraceae bacterium]